MVSGVIQPADTALTQEDLLFAYHEGHGFQFRKQLRRVAEKEVNNFEGKMGTEEVEIPSGK